MGHDLVPFLGRRARGDGRPAARGSGRSRVPSRCRRLPVGGSGVDRRAAAAGHPSSPDRPAPAAGRSWSIHVLRRGSIEPGVPRVPTVGTRLAGHSGGTAALPTATGLVGPARRRRVPPAARRRGAAGAGDSVATRRRSAHPDHAATGSSVQRPRPRSCRRNRCIGPPVAARGARSRRSRRRPSRRRGRPRPHRFSLVVADPRDAAQVRPHLRLGTAADGRLPRLPLHVLAGCPVRVDRTATSGAVPGNPREDGVRAVAPGRWHVGRTRHEPAERREHRAATDLRSAVLRVDVRNAQLGDLDPRRVRLPGNASADLPARRVHALRDPEAELEQAERVPALDVLVGGPRRLAGADALPAGRHVQRRDHRRRGPLRRGQLQGARLEQLVADAVRSRQRRWWSHTGDDGAGAADGRPRRRLADLRGHARAVLRARRGRGCLGCAGAGLGRRVVLRDAPRHPHLPVGDEGGQPPLRAPVARGRAVVGRGRWCTGGGQIRDRTVVEGRAVAAVPRHHPRLVDRLGRRRCGGHTHAGRGSAGENHRRRVRGRCTTRALCCQRSDTWPTRGVHGRR